MVPLLTRQLGVATGYVTSEPCFCQHVPHPPGPPGGEDWASGTGGGRRRVGVLRPSLCKRRWSYIIPSLWRVAGSQSPAGPWALCAGGSLLPCPHRIPCPVPMCL